MKKHVGRRATVPVLGALIIAVGLVGSAWGTGGHKSHKLPSCDKLLGPHTCSFLFDSDERRVLTVLNPDSEEPNFNPQLCTCNVKFVKCDPSITNNDSTSDSTKRRRHRRKSCLSGHPLEGFPANLDLVDDGTTVCVTLGGERTCFTL